MKARFGALSNQNLLIVGFSFTHKQLLQAQAVDTEVLKVLDEESRKTLFVLGNSANTTANLNGVTFPFLNENQDKNVVVGLVLPGNDPEIVKFEAAKVIERLTVVETQVQAVLKNIGESLKSIEELSFDEPTKK